VKSYFSVNTSSISQAMVGGLLLRAGLSLHSYLEPKIEFYRARRNKMLVELERSFTVEHREGRVRWTMPAGGFFLSVSLPFAFGADEMYACVREFDVLVCPSAFFKYDGSSDDRVRLSFSHVSLDEICDGITRFAEFVRQRVATVETARGA
jgi:(S)-3,5-dihydroxyphenylglycine transaminase